MTTSRLGRELIYAMAFKVIAIVLIYVFFFSPSHRQRPSAADTAAFITAGAVKSE